MSDRVVELAGLVRGDDVARWVSNLWERWDNQREEIKRNWLELTEYLYATDTTTTSNQSLPWKNSTTNPKLCQIMDNLHSNYISSLFPNDRWLSWQSFDQQSASREKARVIEGYMENKTRLGNYRGVISDCIYDYIIHGVAFIRPTFEARYNTMPDGNRYPGFVGPKAQRISPYDICFDPTAANFSEAPKIIRSRKSIGEVKKMAMTEPDQGFWMEVVERREELQNLAGGYQEEDWEKAAQYSVDGFGTYYEYLRSNVVEILEFYGDYYDPETGELSTNRLITVADRITLARDIPIPTISGKDNIRMAGWRKRRDNLWAMGPLENLVGMQYRIDHLENLRADAMDLLVLPPLKIVGEVEEFRWEPAGEIFVGSDGDVVEMSKSFNGVLSAANDIAEYEARMELYAGAPREAMGVRSPGEKTAFEVQSLEAASGRIFQEKSTNFEVNLMEPNLNDMFEISVLNFDGADVIRVIDNDLNAEKFLEITPDDIKGNGIIRPIGARHFSQQAQELQNLVGVFNSGLAGLVQPHTSGINVTKFVEDVVNLKQYQLFRPNVAIAEGQQTELLINQAQEDNMLAAQVDPEEGLLT